MAGNMQQHMAALGQMGGVQQQMRRPMTVQQIQQWVYQQILMNSQPQNGLSWQSGLNASDRMGKAMELCVGPLDPCPETC